MWAPCAAAACATPYPPQSPAGCGWAPSLPDSGSLCGRKSRSDCGELYSYGPRYTIGTVAKFPWTGGEGRVHSRPLSSHWFAPAFAPLNQLAMKLYAKMSCERKSRNAEIVMNELSPWIGSRYSYVVGS